MREYKEYLNEDIERIIKNFEGSYEQQQFIRGIELFNKYSNNGKDVIDDSIIESLGIEDLESLMLYCVLISDETGDLEDIIANKCAWVVSARQGDLLLETAERIAEEERQKCI